MPQAQRIDGHLRVEKGASVGGTNNAGLVAGTGRLLPAPPSSRVTFAPLRSARLSTRQTLPRQLPRPMSGS
jgi:hypothetical protein